MLAWFWRVSERCLDLVAPRTCAGCEVQSASPLCAGCRSTTEPGVCQSDQGRVVYLGRYDGPLRDAVHRLKYGDRPDLARPLARALFEAHPALAQTPALLVPIPLHASRLADRGYNQSALLTLELARMSGAPWHASALRRVRAAPPQAHSTAHERWRNVRSAFVASPSAVAGKKVILVDDVVTTRATLWAATGALRDGGADPQGLLALCLAGR